jgi:sortase A
LAKGVWHFESSSYLEGNVCLAAHNTNKFWAKLHTLETGDKITYISFLGTKEYQVTNKTQISETDWSLLENTNENTLTLITCVKGQKEKRLCVQATEIN